MATYKIVRNYRDSFKKRTIDTGLTLEEAQAHCIQTNSPAPHNPIGIKS